jgi:hypothetical protein
MITVRQFFSKYPELLTIPAGLILWMVSIQVLRWLDPTAGVFDAGVFQVPIFAIIQFFVYTSMAWLSLRILYGSLSRYLKTSFKTDFNALTSWQKIKLSYSVFFALLAVLAYLAKTLQ